MSVKLYEKPDKHNPGPIVAILVVVILLLLTSKCHAQQKAVIDTMVCKVECIKQIVQKPSANGKTVKYLAVYVDKPAGFSEIIPISKSVVDYISTCKQFSLEPTLGIRLRNGVITSIVRYKIKFVHNEIQ
jgi:archaellin